jgi:hypothetical protein
MKKIYIEWYDAYTKDGWERTDEAKEICEPLMLCKSIGFLLNEDKDQITICHTYNPQMTMGMLHIPKGTIKRIKRY